MTGIVHRMTRTTVALPRTVTPRDARVPPRFAHHSFRSPFREGYKVRMLFPRHGPRRSGQSRRNLRRACRPWHRQVRRALHNTGSLGGAPYGPAGAREFRISTLLHRSPVISKQPLGRQRRKGWETNQLPIML